MVELIFSKISNSNIYILKSSLEFSTINTYFSKDLEIILKMSKISLNKKPINNSKILISVTNSFSNFEYFDIYAFFEKYSYESIFSFTYDFENTYLK